MTGTGAPYFDALEQRRAEIERTKENAARLATASGRYKSTGQGSIEFDRRIKFGVTFVTKPIVNYGCEIDLDDLDDRLDNDYNENGTPPMPLCTGYVTDWEQNARGFYIGAFVGVRVYYPPEDLVPADFTVGIIHHFHFSTVAMKDVPLDLQDD